MLKKLRPIVENAHKSLIIAVPLLYLKLTNFGSSMPYVNMLRTDSIESD